MRILTIVPVEDVRPRDDMVLGQRFDSEQPGDVVTWVITGVLHERESVVVTSPAGNLRVPQGALVAVLRSVQ